MKYQDPLGLATEDTVRTGGARAEAGAAPTRKHRNTASIINLPALISIILCAILWLAAPFLAINILTLDNQPSALQLLMDDVTYIGSLVEDPAFWAAVGSLVGIIVCFLCVIAKKYTGSRVIAALTELPLLIALVHRFLWAADDPGTTLNLLSRSLGIGFWGIALLLLVVVLWGGNKAAVRSGSGSSESNV